MRLDRKYGLQTACDLGNGLAHSMACVTAPLLGIESTCEIPYRDLWRIGCALCAAPRRRVGYVLQVLQSRCKLDDAAVPLLSTIDTTVDTTCWTACALSLTGTACTTKTSVQTMPVDRRLGNRCLACLAIGDLCSRTPCLYSLRLGDTVTSLRLLRPLPLPIHFDHDCRYLNSYDCRGAKVVLPVSASSAEYGTPSLREQTCRILYNDRVLHHNLVRSPCVRTAVGAARCHDGRMADGFAKTSPAKMSMRILSVHRR